MTKTLDIWIERNGQPRGYLIASLFPYQVALGVSVRFLEGAHLRIYFGPFKLALGTIKE